MGEHIRRIVSLAILPVLVICILAAGSTSAAAEDLQAAKASLTDGLFEYLSVQNGVYTKMLRFLDQTELFLEKKDWDSLLKARAAGSSMLMLLRQGELPTLDMTQEQAAMLIEYGIEADVVQMLYEEWEESVQQLSDSVLLLNSTLEHDVFLTVTIEDMLPAMVRNYKDMLANEVQYYSLTANYVLLQADRSDLWETWIVELPCMAACSNGWLDSTDVLRAAADKVLTEYSEGQSEISRILGMGMYALELVQEAVELGDVTKLSKEVGPIPEVPGYFPSPAWTEDAVELYLVTDPGSQEKILVKPGQDMRDAPSACYILCGKIELEEVLLYEDALKEYGFAAYGSMEEGSNKYSLLVLSAESNMMIQWTEEETLIYLPDPVGCLIPGLYLQAIALQ